MADLKENLKYKEFKYLCQLYIGNPIHRSIKSFESNKNFYVKARTSTLECASEFDFLSFNHKIKGSYAVLRRWLYKADYKTFLWVVFSNASSLIIIGGLVN